MSARGLLTDPRTSGSKASSTIRRLVVTWQHPVQRSIQPVGLLECEAGVYRFGYVRFALTMDGFRPFPGFPELYARYESDQLFPLFAQRVMDPRRPDYGRLLSVLDLPEDASPWEVLSRSEGRRMGDSIQVFPEPVVEPDGRTFCRFLVHGIRHMIAKRPETDELLVQLRSGEELQLIDDVDNPVNPRAVITASGRGSPLGWVPDLMLDYLHTARAQGAVQVAVDHVNGPRVSPHLRLLAHLTGRVPAGYHPFTGPDWEFLA